MRIALYHDLPSGGAKRAVFETVRRLVQHHVVDVYTLSTANHDFCDLRPLVHQHYIFEFQPLLLFRKPFRRFNRLQRWRNLKRLEPLAKQIASEIDSRSYDLIYVHPSMWVQAPMVLNYLQTPTFYHVHESLRLVYETEIFRPYIKKGWRRKAARFDPLISLYLRKLTELDRRNTLRATYLLANSYFTAANIQRIYKRQAEVAYFGVDSDIFCPRSDLQTEKFVLSVGELRPNKGFDFIIKAMARLPTAIRPPLKLIGNAGQQQECNYLVNLAKENSVDLTIEVNVDFETLLRRYNQAVMLVYAPIQEPLGLVPLEAMACATPVVGVAEGGVKETVIDGTTGFLTSRELNAFAEAIEKLLMDQDLNRQMGQAGRQHVQMSWTWDIVVQRIETCLTAASL